MFLPQNEIRMLWQAGACCFHPQLHRHLFFSEKELKGGFDLEELVATNPGVARDLGRFVQDNPKVDNLVLRYLGSEKHLKDVVNWSKPDIYIVFEQWKKVNEVDKQKIFFSDLLMRAWLAKIDGQQASARSGSVRFQNLVIPPNLDVEVGGGVLLHWGVVLERADRVPDVGWTIESIDQYDNMPDFYRGRWQEWKPTPDRSLTIDFENLGGFNFTELNEGRLYE